MALLGYTVVLRGRKRGWFGPFGLAVASILCFLLVVAAWLGMDFQVGYEPVFYDIAIRAYVWLGLYGVVEVLFVLGMWAAASKARIAEPKEAFV